LFSLKSEASYHYKKRACPAQAFFAGAILKSQMSKTTKKLKIMKKIMFTAALFLMGFTAFCQEEENGTIYIKHPYIDVVNQADKGYETQDWAALQNLYSDTAKWWASGMHDFIPISDAMQNWKKDFEFFDNVQQVPQGYPDYLHYKKGDVQVVQSWWTWTGKSKKTGEVVKVPMVIFDEFNADGKISREYIYGDFSKLTQEEGM
jgi:hypothetical protein